MGNMEKRLPPIILFLLLIAPVFSQSTTIETMIEFHVWFSVDPAPIKPESVFNSPQKEELTHNSFYTYAISGIREITPFILEGRLYGWSFSYTPSDKTRQVKEYFELTPINTVSIDDPALHFSDAFFSSDSTSCSTRIEYKRSPYQMKLEKFRESIKFPKISGIGEGDVFDETRGIKDAFSNAAKNAIRMYFRTIVKNKPKEISGIVYLCDKPRYYIKSGKYIADLDFFLETGTIVPYTRF